MNWWLPNWNLPWNIELVRIVLSIEQNKIIFLLPYIQIITHTFIDLKHIIFLVWPYSLLLALWMLPNVGKAEWRWDVTCHVICVVGVAITSVRSVHSNIIVRPPGVLYAMSRPMASSTLLKVSNLYKFIYIYINYVIWMVASTYVHAK